MNRQTADAFDEFDADDDFLDASEDAPEDPFLDAEAVERRLLGEEDAPRSRAPAEDAHRPFGARLAEANAADTGSDPFGDAGYDDEPFETQRPHPPRAGLRTRPARRPRGSMIRSASLKTLKNPIRSRTPAPNRGGSSLRR